jgi:hypothetical protein
MARTIQSPGVEIKEVDLSLAAIGQAATTVFVPGFASRGPVAEPFKIASISQFEQIFGQPTNAAERYFYHTVKAVFQSPADVLVYRLPYGGGAGVGTSQNFSALVYPVVSYVNSASSTSLTTANSHYYFGKPTHVRLSEVEYLDILRGNAFNWSADTGGVATFETVPSLSAAGLIILNKSQSSINSRYEGYYVGIVDNTNLDPATPFNDINAIKTINNSNLFINNYIDIPSVRLNFPLSAAPAGVAGSISEVLENIPTFNIYNPQFNDTAIVGLFKLRQSIFSPDTIALDYVLEEGFIGSFDNFRQINNVNGGPPTSFFLENLDDTSLNITTLVNPYISNKATTTWLDLSGIPSKMVRFLSEPIATPKVDESADEYETRLGAPSASLQAFINTYGTTNALFSLGDYESTDLTTKVIGNVPAKLVAAFDKLENADVYPINITVEAGLGTVYINSFNPLTDGYFDDSIVYGAINALSASDLRVIPSVIQNYLGVANEFINFASNKRKDHIYIADPITNIFVQGLNVKTLDDPTKSFSTNIYWPLRNQFNAINTNYACTFANCGRTVDVITNQQIWVPFSGFAAANFANTDSTYQPWYAPAGFTRGIVTGLNDLAFYPKQKQRDQLYKIGINPIAFFPAEGFVIFGQKTLQQKPSVFDRINVRRLFLSLENRTRETVKFFVFEPNTLFTRTNVVNTITPIFDNAKNTQGIFDYLIICDERNNTPEIIDDGVLVIDIYVKPVRTAEFILCNFYATRTGTNFQEIVT